MSRAFLCVSVDVTGDLDPRGQPCAPRSFLGVRDGVARRLVPLLAEHRAKATLLASADALDDPLSVETLRAASARAELGVGTRGLDPSLSSLSELRAVVDGFIRAFGHQPAAHRRKDGADRATIEAAEDLGVGVDGSVVPGTDLARGGIDLVDAPRQPYRADRSDPARPGPSRVVEVPVTVATRTSLFRRRGPARVLSPATEEAETLLSIASDAIADARRARPGSPVVLHAVLACTDVVGRDEAQAHKVLARLGALLAFARRDDVAVVGLSDVPEILRL